MNTFNHWRGRHLDIEEASIYVEETGNPQGPALRACLVVLARSRPGTRLPRALPPLTA